ncbi:MAG: hypothetical protein M0Z84_15465 [Gammaproteobacteria bacterium]|nr:hypothetical protein [Gammaproteobacteria bacterium]
MKRARARIDEQDLAGHNDHVMRALSRCWFAQLSVEGLAPDLDSKMMSHYDQQAGAKRKRASRRERLECRPGIARFTPPR